MYHHRIVVKSLFPDIRLTRYVRCTLKRHTCGILVSLFEVGQTYVQQGVLTHRIILISHRREMLNGTVHVTRLELRHTQQISVMTLILTLTCSKITGQQIHSLGVLALTVPVFTKNTLGLGLNLGIIGCCHQIIGGLIRLTDISAAVQRHIGQIEAGLVIMACLQGVLKSSLGLRCLTVKIIVVCAVEYDILILLRVIGQTLQDGKLQITLLRTSAAEQRNRVMTHHTPAVILIQQQRVTLVKTLYGIQILTLYKMRRAHQGQHPVVVHRVRVFGHENLYGRHRRREVTLGSNHHLHILNLFCQCLPAAFGHLYPIIKQRTRSAIVTLRKHSAALIQQTCIGIGKTTLSQYARSRSCQQQ